MTLRHWQDLTTVDFNGLDPERTVAVMPLGAVEQHGPHLPLSTDAVIAEEMTRRALDLVPADVPALLLPTMAIGKSNEHLAYPGTLTLTAKTLMDVWFETAEGVKRAGLAKILFVNAHGGQPQVMEIVARELRVRHGMLAVSSSWWHMGLPDGLVSADEARHGIHGGTVETSIMLHLRPDLVRMDRAADFVSVLPDTEAATEGCAMSAAWGSAGRHRICTRRARPGTPPRRRRISGPGSWRMSRKAWPNWSRRCRGTPCLR